MPETAIGFFTDVGCGYFLPRINNGDSSLGLYVGLTGKRIKGKDLIRFGIATHYVEEDKLPLLYQELIKQVNPKTSLDTI